MGNLDVMTRQDPRAEDVLNEVLAELAPATRCSVCLGLSEQGLLFIKLARSRKPAISFDRITDVLKRKYEFEAGSSTVRNHWRDHGSTP